MSNSNEKVIFELSPNFYDCGKQETNSKTTRGKKTKVSIENCVEKFAADNNFIVVETADDGNCFYDTLSKFGKRSGNPKVNKTHLQLRQEIIGAMLKPEWLEKLSNFYVPNNGKTLKEELEEYLKPHIWAGWIGDFIPQVAAEILGINIVIFDVRNEQPSNKINKLYFNNTKTNASTPTVNMLRTNGSHFRLLWEKDAPVLPRGKRTITAKKIVVSPSNTLQNLSKKLGNIDIGKNSVAAAAPATRSRAAPATRKKSSSPKPVERRVTRSMVKPAPSENVIVLNRSKSKTKKRTNRKPSSLELAIEASEESAKSNARRREELERNALQRALAASLKNNKLPPLGNNFFNIFEKGNNNNQGYKYF